MTAATTTRHKPAIDHGTLKLAGKPEPSTGSPKYHQVPIGFIKPSPFNPRQHFDEQELKRLADSLKSHRQQVPCVVRMAGKDYELIDGERRWRAAKLAGLATVECKIIEADDAMAVELAGIANYQREQFNAIEEAGWFRSMLEMAGYTQEKLAERLKVTQGQVSNRLRLLQLPEAIQKRIISGEIPVTWARHLAAWTHRSAVVDDVVKAISHNLPEDEHDFVSTIERAIDNHSRPIKRGEYFSCRNKNGFQDGYVQFNVSKDQIEALQVETHKDSNGSSQQICWNLALWEKLQVEGVKKTAERETSKGEKLLATAKTPADIKARQKELAEQFSRRLYKWKIAWLQTLLPARLEKASDAVLFRLMMHTAIFTGSYGVNNERVDAFESAMKDAGGRFDTGEILAACVDLPDAKVPKLIRAFVKELVVMRGNNEAPLQFDSEEIELLADNLGVDVAKEWKLTEDYLQLHTTAQLQALCKEWDLGYRLMGKPPAILHAANPKRGELIVAILEECKTHSPRCPKEVLAVKEQ